MPELPEIETVKLQLQKVLVGLKIVSITVRGNKTVQGDIRRAEGKKVLGVRRAAKVLMMDLSDGLSMAFHFKMTGQLVYDKDDNPKTWKDRVVGGHPTEDFLGPLPSTHTRVIFKMNRGTLYFNDQRMFGWVITGKTEEINNLKFIKSLGPEPFDVDEERFVKIFEKVKKPIKLALMDQEKISGVGNIYANDACWEAKVDPRRPANSLTAKQYRELFEGVKKVLREGIKYGGATAADAKYIDLHGLGGHYQDHFKTYDREGEHCLRDDGGTIHRMAMGGRGTYFCPKCQV